MIEIRDLRFSYNGHAPYLLDGLSLNVERGAYVSIAGENGCGKTTLMRLILGFLKPVSGTIRMGAKRIGYVPQTTDFAARAFPITVEEMLSSWGELLGLGRRSKEAAFEALELTGMLERRSRLAGDLSGGERERVLIARALMGDADLLILDEPSTGLDPEGQRSIYSLLTRLRKTRGLTIAAVEHNPAMALSQSSDIIHIVNGRAHVCSAQRYAAESVGGRLFANLSNFTSDSSTVKAKPEISTDFSALRKKSDTVNASTIDQHEPGDAADA